MPPSILDQITPVVLTYNEAPNIGRCLDKLTWAHRVLLIDSGSTDDTLAIAARYGQVEVVHRPFDTFADQCNFALTQVASDWVLSMDCDYILTDELIAELGHLSSAVDGYEASFIYCIHGHRLRATLYPPRTVLYRRAKARYHNEGHGHRVAIDGRVARLAGRIEHDDRKPLARWLGSQQRYARIEADHLLSVSHASLGRNDRIRLMGWPAPILVFFYTLLAKGCLFDGWPGWLYVLQRVAAETMIALEIVDRRVAGGVGRAAGPISARKA